MSTKATGNKKHLTLADRAAIEHGISRGENFTQIACRINKDSSTISKEIRRHLFRVPHFQSLSALQYGCTLPLLHLYERVP